MGLARLKGRWLLAGAALLAVVQVWDVSPGMVQRSAAMLQAMQTDAFPTEMESDFWQAAQQYTAVASMDEIQDDALHLALFAADNGHGRPTTRLPPAMMKRYWPPNGKRCWRSLLPEPCGRIRCTCLQRKVPFCRPWNR